MATALLFDRDRVDEIDDWTDSLPKVGRSAIPWIDLEAPAEDDIVQLVDRFDLENGTANDLLQRPAEPRLADHGTYLHVAVIGLSDERGQRTNEMIMKVLTLASVLLLLPGALIARAMGMNFKVGLFETAGYFWVAGALIAVVAVATLVVARVRAWI